MTTLSTNRMLTFFADVKTEDFWLANHLSAAAALKRNLKQITATTLRLLDLRVVIHYDRKLEM